MPMPDWGWTMGRRVSGGGVGVGVGVGVGDGGSGHAEEGHDS